MIASTDDIEAEYQAAMQSMTPAQTQALAMLKRAQQFERMNNLTLHESLRRVFEEVAADRNGVVRPGV